MMIRNPYRRARLCATGSIETNTGAPRADRTRRAPVCLIGSVFDGGGIALACRAPHPLEQVHLREVVTRMAKRWRQAAPDLRPLKHPRDLLAHSRFEVYRIASEVRWYIWLPRELLVWDGLKPVEYGLVGGIRIFQQVSERQAIRELASLLRAQSNANAVRDQTPTPLPARLVNQLRLAANERLERPVLCAGDVPEVKSERVRVGKDARGQFVGGQVASEIMQNPSSPLG